MPEIIRRHFNSRLGISLAAFAVTLSLAIVVCWATVGLDPSAMIASVNHTKA